MNESSLSTRRYRSVTAKRTRLVTTNRFCAPRVSSRRVKSSMRSFSSVRRAVVVVTASNDDSIASEVAENDARADETLRNRTPAAKGERHAPFFCTRPVTHVVSSFLSRNTDKRRSRNVEITKNFPIELSPFQSFATPGSQTFRWSDSLATPPVNWESVRTPIQPEPMNGIR